MQKLLSLIYSYLFIFAFVALDRGDISKKYTAKTDIGGVYCQKLYGFKSLIHFEFIFVFCTWCKEVVQLHSSACSCPVGNKFLVM